MGKSLPRAGFGGLKVVSFESRRAQEMATLISAYGGVPLVAPSMREIPLEDNPVAFRFAERLLAGELDAVIFMTGVGTRTLMEVLQARYPLEKIVQSLSRVTVVARGPKPVKVLRELQVPITLTVPEPNTWREILQELDKSQGDFSLRGKSVAVQEYGVSNEAFLRELAQRGAEVHRVVVYRWALPEDVQPMLKAMEAIVEGRVGVVLFTNAAQVDHVVRLASVNGLKERLLDAVQRCAVCSVGPTSTEAFLAQGIGVDLEPEHPKMGALVRESANRAADLLREKLKRTQGTA